MTIRWNAESQTKIPQHNMEMIRKTRKITVATKRMFRHKQQYGPKVYRTL